MPEASPSKRPILLPLICYRDPERAVAWLQKSFGLETRGVVKRSDGGFAYAHLGAGDGWIMVSPLPAAAPEAQSPYIKAAAAKPESAIKPTADAAKAAAPQACYLVVDDIEAHYKRAKEAGAKIEVELKDHEPGGLRYSCRDLEGNIWTFGTYDPWKGGAAADDTAKGAASTPVGAEVTGAERPLARNRAPVAVAGRRAAWPRFPLGRRSGVIAAAALTLAALGVAGWQLVVDSRHAAVATAEAEAAREAELRRTESEFAAARQELTQVRAVLAQERSARVAAQQSQSTIEATLAAERSGREKAERSLQELKAALPQDDAAEVAEVRAALEKERAAALASAQSAAEELKAEHAQRLEAERLLQELKAALPQDDAAAAEVAEVRAALAKERAAALASAQSAAEELKAEHAQRLEAERAAAALKTELAAAQAARAKAEEAAHKANERATELASRATEPAHPAPPAPVPAETAHGDGFVTTTTRADGAMAVAAAAKPAAAAVSASPPATAQNPKLAAGAAALAKGDLAAARRYFKELADAGVPEGALALGSTYDPKTLERAGLAGAQADRARAKEWYRRAIELAQPTERQTQQ